MSTKANRFSIVEKEHAYCTLGNDGSTRRITNFSAKDVKLIKDENGSQLSMTCVTENGQSFPVTMSTTDFSSCTKFKTALNKTTLALSFLGNNCDLENLKALLHENAVSIESVATAGIHTLPDGQSVYISSKGSIDANGNAVTNIVQSEKKVGIESNILDFEVLSKANLPVLFHLLLKYNTFGNAIVILAWIGCAFLKAHLFSKGIKIPLLLLVGEAGSGKSTTLEQIVLAIFSACTKPLAAAELKDFGVLQQSSSSNLIPLAIDEFKPSRMNTETSNICLNALRSSYDGQGCLRGHADQSITRYSLHAPLIVAGEEAPNETAIRERCAMAFFAKQPLEDPACQDAIHELRLHQDDLACFGRALLTLTLNTTAEEAKTWYDAANHPLASPIFSTDLPPRVISNLAGCYAGLCFLKKLCTQYGYNWDEAFPYDFDSCVKTLESAARSNLLEGSTHNKTVVEQSLEIMSRMPRGIICEHVKFSPDGKELSIHFSGSGYYDEFTKYCKDHAIQAEILPYNQFMQQLKLTNYLIRSNVSTRFSPTNTGKANVVSKATVLNYTLLQKQCDVSGFEAIGNTTSP